MQEEPTYRARPEQVGLTRRTWKAVVVGDGGE